MSIYAIGDVQGCLSQLEKLLKLIDFKPSEDTLWFTGDIVNRGPQSLETLRFIQSLGDKHIVVLGNHDLHLLAVAHNAHAGWSEDTLAPILKAPDCDVLINWLCHRPLLHHDELLNVVMVHAGLAPAWDLSAAKKHAHEIEKILRSDARREFFQNMYGNQPDLWQDDLIGWDRFRCIVNYFTRARFCDEEGRLLLSIKETALVDETKHLIPWFQNPQRKTNHQDIIFGHWAALGGVTNTAHVFALDTGCVWGYALTAMRLTDLQRWSVPCS
ncbi:MAG: symmetrical bis(5'-nucleosyl)-tetraphosphatase [Gammaproteobacteria bacterium]|nr:symmetrical bis(5'-nucleosyl)-tetraphosphatase [Gammaproteobacteria bacterium]